MPFSDFITPTGVLPLKQVDMVPPEWAAPLLQPQLGATLATEINQGIVALGCQPLPRLQSGVLILLSADMVGPDHPTPPPKLEGAATLNLLPPPFPTPPPRIDNNSPEATFILAQAGLSKPGETVPYSIPPDLPQPPMANGLVNGSVGPDLPAPPQK